MTSDRPKYSVLDTGPCLNFMGTGNSEILLRVLENISGELIVPEDVADEVSNKASEIATYRGAAVRLYGAEADSRITIATSKAGDDPALDVWVAKLFGVPRAAVAARAKDLGEKMVIAHARTMKDRGESVIVVINDGVGQELASAHKVTWISTITILRKAALLGLIPDRGEMREIYGRMQPHDLSLPSIEAPSVFQQLLAKDLAYGSQAGRLTPLTGS